MKKVFLLCLALFLCTENIFSQSQGPNGPTSASYSAIGCLSCPGSEWNNYSNIMTGDLQSAEVSLPGYPMCFQSNCYYSRYLLARGFGFSIPQNAVIDGVEAEIICMSGGASITDTIVQLLLSNQLAGNNNSPGSIFPWQPSTAVILFGSNTDLWGLPLTPDSINNPGFGIGVMVTNTSTAQGDAYVDHVRLTVHYSVSTGTFSQTKTSGIRDIYFSSEENALIAAENVFNEINTVSISDAVGKNISSFSPSRGQQKYFLPALSNGIYFAIARTGEKTIARKFLVNK